MGSPLVLRDARVDDVDAIAELWADSLRDDDPRADVARLVSAREHTDDFRVIVAEYDGAFAGAVLVQVGTVSPLNLSPVVQIVSPTVLPSMRRRGVGRSLVEAGVAFAEQRGVPQVSTASLSVSRDANRFMARLGLATRASLRLAPTTAVRARITAMRRPATVHSQSRQPLTQVLAARRSARRQLPRVG